MHSISIHLCALRFVTCAAQAHGMSSGAQHFSVHLESHFSVYLFWAAVNWFAACAIVLIQSPMFDVAIQLGAHSVRCDDVERIRVEFEEPNTSEIDVTPFNDVSEIHKLIIFLNYVLKPQITILTLNGAGCRLQSKWHLIQTKCAWFVENALSNGILHLAFGLLLFFFYAHSLCCDCTFSFISVDLCCAVVKGCRKGDESW